MRDDRFGNIVYCLAFLSLPDKDGGGVEGVEYMGCGWGAEFGPVSKEGQCERRSAKILG